MTKPKRSGWLCPECRRRFGRTNQSHSCVPTLSVDGYFDARPAGDRKIYDAVARYLESLGEITIDVVSVGVLFKRVRTFAELRPRRRGMSLAFLFSRELADDRLVKSLKTSAHRVAHFVDLASPRDLDRTVKGWLAEAYATSPT